MVAPPKQITSHKSVHWYQWSMCNEFMKKCLLLNINPWQRKSFVKNSFFAKHSLIFYKKKRKRFPTNFLLLIQAPNMSKHISRNRGATIKASWKLAHKFVFILGKMPFFSLQKWWHHPKKVIALNLYIGINILVYERCLVLKVWYTVSRPATHPGITSIDSNCLSMRVKKWSFHTLCSC